MFHGEFSITDHVSHLQLDHCDPSTCLDRNNGKAGASIDKIKVSTEQILNMIRRVTNRRRGLKEDDALTLVQAFVTSRIVYAAPYLKLLKKDRDQLNVIIRKATKMALGLPKHSSTDKLHGMAKHNPRILEDQLVLISRGQAAREAYGSREEGTTSIDGG
ncbi:hypothetical protein HPB47_002938 [Ixodes persulcatus]|uniref:Uncharacterized protein n=1 Tax=Ixodes persulcatus TaxID=34615 RepID=A0AC60PJW8_IXOPE|nr:hypothetical protein HPB47_002938 [Ixodes persulcatus]